MPHPVRAIGKLISAGERMCKPGRHPQRDFIGGVALSSFTVAIAWLVGRSACRLLCIGPAAEVLLAWTTLATRSLLSEASAVLDAVEAGDLPRARRSLSMIVGRDTAFLQEPEIARALIETIAESLCDGIVAPLWHLSLGGVPAALAYKAANTLDSMVGHPEPPYTYFGRFAARLDDVMNFLPARATALAIVAVSAFSKGSSYRRAWTTWRRDRRKHPSPNAGQSEAAMAGALGVTLGGISYYSGRASVKPLLGAHFRTPSIEQAQRSLSIARKASALAFAVALAWCVWRRPR